LPAWLLLLVSLALGVPVAWTIVRGREHDRQRRARAFERELANELLQQASGLDRLVATLGGLADASDGDRVLGRACAGARRLVGADATVLLEAMADGYLRPCHRDGGDEDALRHLAVRDAEEAAASVGRALGARVVHGTPLHTQGELIGVLVVARNDPDATPFSPTELAQLRVIADFTARAAQNARLYVHLERLRSEAEERERERARLSNQLVEAEHAERRRLAMLLHDGPQQTVTGVALMMDACLESIAGNDTREASRLLGIARDRNREAARDLRELSFSLEPAALREQGLTGALLPLAEKLGEAHGVRFHLDLEAAEALTADRQSFTYQIVREAIANAIKHARPSTIAIVARTLDDGATELVVRDDGAGIRRAVSGDGLGQGTAGMRERAATMGGTVEWRRGDLGGTEVVLVVPPPSIAQAA
jgi:signal transduction histidine kinase